MLFSFRKRAWRCLLKEPFSLTYTCNTKRTSLVTSFRSAVFVTWVLFVCLKKEKKKKEEITGFGNITATFKNIIS